MRFDTPEQEAEWWANEAAIDRDVKEAVAQSTAERQAAALERIADALEAMNARAVVEAPGADVAAFRAAAREVETRQLLGIHPGDEEAAP